MVKAACDGKLKRSRTTISNRPAHWDEQGRLHNKCFFRAMNYARDGCGQNRPHCHRNVGQTEIQGTLEYWNQKLKLTQGTRFEKKHGEKPHRLTTDMARRTFCTLAELDTGESSCVRFDCAKTISSIFFLPSVLFGYHSNAVMAVSHHDDMDTYKGYIVHSACVEHTLKNLLCMMALLEFKCCNI